MGILLELSWTVPTKYKNIGPRHFYLSFSKKKKKNAFLFMVEVNIGLKIILKNVLWKKKK